MLRLRCGPLPRIGAPCGQIEPIVRPAPVILSWPRKEPNLLVRWEPVATLERCGPRRQPKSTLADFGDNSIPKSATADFGCHYPSRLAATPLARVTIALTYVSVLVTYTPEPRPSRTRPGRHAGLRGECGARGRACNPRSGGFGHHLSGTTTGARGAIAGLGQAGAGNARSKGQAKPVPPRPRKPGLRLSPLR